MTYKSNFEPYISMSPDINHSGSASVYTEPLDLLQGLYPYVAGMQKQSNSAYFSGYNPDYWGEAYVEPCPQEEIPRHSFRRLSEVSSRRLVSRLRKLLPRERREKRRLDSTATTPC